jgi:hypothetical protein
MRINRAFAVPAAVAVTAAILSAGVAPAVAKDGDVSRSGSCSPSGTWKLKASPENGRIEVEGEVDSNRNGQSWHWSIRHDGSVAASGQRTTVAPSGSFEVRRVLANRAGTDTFVLTARRDGSQQLCRGTVRF